MNKDGQIEVIESPTELDQAVAQAFERAANEAASEGADLVEGPVTSESQNTTGNTGNLNEESTAEVSSTISRVFRFARHGTQFSWHL